MFENPQAATAKFGVPETLALTQFLKLVLLVQVIVMFVVVAAASEKGSSGNAGVVFVFNGALTLVKAAFIFGVIRALKIRKQDRLLRRACRRGYWRGVCARDS